MNTPPIGDTFKIAICSLLKIKVKLKVKLFQNSCGTSWLGCHTKSFLMMPINTVGGSHGSTSIIQYGVQNSSFLALMMACSHDSDAMHLMRAAKVVRKEIFNSGFVFDGTFKANCQEEAVPPFLLALVNMILDGANIKNQNQLVHTTTTKPALTIAQLMVSNSMKHARNVNASSSARHSRSRDSNTTLSVSQDPHIYMQ